MAMFICRHWSEVVLVLVLDLEDVTDVTEVASFVE